MAQRIREQKEEIEKHGGMAALKKAREKAERINQEKKAKQQEKKKKEKNKKKKKKK